MASHASAGNAGVIYRYRTGTGKGRRRNTMAIVANIRRRRMYRTLGATDTARRMTVDALAGYNLRMINHKGSETSRRNTMAGLASIGRLRMR